MNQERNAAVSPFAALSYQEQQDRWLEWRSRQLDYRKAEEIRDPFAEMQPSKREEPPAAYPQLKDPPPIQVPNIHNPAPTRHRELDKLWAKHAQAAKMAGQYQTVSK